MNSQISSVYIIISSMCELFLNFVIIVKSRGGLDMPITWNKDCNSAKKLTVFKTI